MKVFYTAKSYSGETKSGELDVKDERDLAGQLRADGYALTSFKELKKTEEKKMKMGILDRFSTIPMSEKMMFARNLSVMISSGLPLSKAISNLTAQTQNKRFAKMLSDIQEDLQGGAMLADGLAKYPGVFGELFVNMVRVGETSGNLEEVLVVLAAQMEKDYELIRSVRGAMVYPSVIIVAMIGIGILMMTFVVPQITSVFKDLNAELPASTQFIINLSEMFKNHGILVIAGMVAFAVLLRMMLLTKPGKKLLSLTVIKVPVVKNIVIKMNCARFARTYSSLLKSGVSVVETLRIISNTLTNYYYKKAMTKASESIQKGVPLSKLIYEEKAIFPVLVPQMIEVGEETGKTETVLLKLAEFYEDEVGQLTKNLSSIIEPVLMIIIGSAVGFFAISILQPMYSVLQNIK